MAVEVPYHPELYTLCTFLGAAAAGSTYRRWPQELPMPRPVARTYYACVFAAATLGAYSVQPLHLLFGAPGVTGHSIMTALFVAWITAETIKRFAGITAPTGEPLAVGLAGAMCIGRIGCLFGHCCLGAPYDGELALIDHGRSYFPAPLLECVFHGAAFLVLRRWTLTGAHPGNRFRLYVAAYCVFRFFSEFARGYTRIGLGLSLYQWLSLALFGIILLQLSAERSTAQTAEAP